MRLRYFAQTNTGIVRKENQDTFGVSVANNIYFVCDGMGGGAAGDFASKCATEVMLKSMELITDEVIGQIVGTNYRAFTNYILRPVVAIRLANRMLSNLTEKYPKLRGMGTTVTALMYEPSKGLAHIYHVGDSRVYRLRSGTLTLLTKDHSKVNELIDEGKMSEAEAKTAELQSMITRALGTASVVKIDYKTDLVRAGDVYIICSDGLNGEIEDGTIRDIININKPDPKTIPQELILSAISAGGRDNITVVTLLAEDDGAAYEAPSKTQEEAITIPEETAEQSAAEDKFLSKNAASFTVEVPKSAREKNIFNPLILALLFVLLMVGGIFVYSVIPRAPSTEFKELTGAFSGLELNVRTISPEHLRRIAQTHDRVFRLELFAQAFRQPELYTIALENVKIIITDVQPHSPHKFLGLSGSEALEIRLPAGRYVLQAIHPGYRILNAQFEPVRTLDISLELSQALRNFTIIMMPQAEE
ncbi:MAG: protein phosphatase 2C domain-containing protein [Elusimicrobia bacterium]|nr:protein phosphatase 2C domain-containing protein [Elusimicrobiota bacterium]